MSDASTIFDDLVGNERAKNILERAFLHCTLSHAYLFAGPKSIGKFTVASKLAQALLGVSNLTLHPDFRFVHREHDEKTGKMQRDISVEQIRELISWASGSAQAATNIKIAIIDEAERLNVAAANAILKTLEEPSGNAHFFLIAADEEILPTTIRSRCQLVRFTNARDAEMEALAETLGLAKDDAAKLLPLSAQSPGRLVRLATDAEYQARQIREAQRFMELKTLPLHARFQAVSDFWDADGDHMESRDRLGEVLGLWMLMTRKSLAMGEAKSTFLIGEHVDFVSPIAKQDGHLLPFLKLLTESRLDLRHNVHPKFIINQLLIAMSYEN
ncbi:MAG: DNA polymerase III subunit delta' [Candidatus Magasanikbacteria bacterium]|nr:DNA polymerase III subunit delta' [Candidatus Magasanikbacteria bacterium]